MVPKGKHALLFLNGILLGSHDTGSFKVLFEGSQKGSLEMVSPRLGTTVVTAGKIDFSFRVSKPHPYAGLDSLKTP